MKLRLTGLVVVALLVFAYRGAGIYLQYFSADLSSTLPLKTSRSGEHFVIKAIDLDAPSFRGRSEAELPRAGDRIVEIYDHEGNGGAVGGLFDYGAYIKPINVSHPWTLVVGRPGPGGVERITFSMPPSTPLVWSGAEWLTHLGVDFYLPFLAALTGLLIGLSRPRDNQAYLASLLFMSLAVVVGPPVSQFPRVLRETALLVGVTGRTFLPYLVFLFFLRFPARSPLDRALPWLNAALLALTAVAWGASLAWEFSRHVSFQAAHGLDTSLAGIGLSAERLESLFTGLAASMILLALASVLLNARLAASPDERRRLRIVAAGAVAGLLPAAVLLALASARVQVPIGVPLVAIPLIGLFPLSFAYAVVRHRVFGIRLIVRRGLKYALVSRGFLVAEGVAIFVVLLGLVGSGFRWLNPESDVLAASAGAAVATLVLTLGMRRLNRQVLPLIDRHFFRDAYDTRRILTDFSRAVRRMASRPGELLECVAKEIEAALHPARIAIFLRPDAVTGLTPLGGGRGACWQPPDAPGAGPLVLYVDDVPVAARFAPPPGDHTVAARTPLAAHLAACAAGEPETLDVLAFESPAPGAPMPPGRGDRRRGGCMEDENLLTRFDARLVVPLVTGGRALGFLLLGEKLSEEPYGREDRELLTTVAGQVAIALDYAHLIEQAAEQAALRREVQIAQEVQRQLFPHERPPMRSLRYSGICRAARGVGGDFYDFLPLTGDRLGLALADIAGKGLPAALLMASLQALLRSHAPTHSTDLGLLGAELNRHLVETSDGARFASLFFGVYDDRSRELQYLNAGHLPPIIVSGGDAHSRATVRRLDTGGMVLGLFAGQPYVQRSVSLQPGDRIAIFSDGVTEAADPAGEMFGEERLIEAVLRHGSLPAEELPEQVLSEVMRFVGDSPQQDDITVIAAQVA
ncbi:MAG TPA: PP2C family protein-serine/threonine phosphatase [Vicinamibacterales bacterium]|nr:PP2C family protein-serine/threonine phosphatase [Vicinamibacterales bacterium]